MDTNTMDRMNTDSKPTPQPERTVTIPRSQGLQIAEILKDRANEIAQFSDKNRGTLPESIHVALTREMRRLRGLADLVTHEEGVRVPDDHDG